MGSQPTEPSPEFNTIKRVSPATFEVCKALGGQTVSKIYKISANPHQLELETEDLKALYEDATTDGQGGLVEVRFVHEEDADTDAILSRESDGNYSLVRKTATGIAGMSGCSPDALQSVHRLFALDGSREDVPSSTMYAGYNADGNFEVIEIGEVKPGDF